MFKSNLIAGIIGIAVVCTFLGVLLVWLKSVPLTIIAVGVVGLIIYDYVTTLRQESGNSGG